MIIEKTDTVKLSTSAGCAFYATMADTFVKQFQQTFGGNIPTAIRYGNKKIAIRAPIEQNECERHCIFRNDGIETVIDDEWQFSATIENDNYNLHYHFLRIVQFRKIHANILYVADSLNELRKKISG